MVEDRKTHSNPDTSRRKSLLKKYEIPIDQLSYEYIGTCSDAKKLERIVRILRSGEEGYFPDLQRVAEDRLRLLNPNNRQLRDEKPVLTPSSMTKKEWADIASDLGNWKTEVAMRDMKLTEENNNEVDDSCLPPVRQPTAPINPDEIQQQKCVKKRVVSDYSAWDKYNPDVEILKMDLEEERAAEKKKINRTKHTLTTTTLEDRLREVRREAEKLSETERKKLAELKKDQGNEFYKSKDYVEALKLYSESLEVWPTLNAYNNRAECNLKLCKYSEAQTDASSALEMQRNNVKAFFRRGMAHKGLNMYAQAITDFQAVLKLEPRNSEACKMLNELNLKQKQQSSTTITRNPEAGELPKRHQRAKIVEIVDDQEVLSTSPRTGTTFRTPEAGDMYGRCQMPDISSTSWGAHQNFRTPQASDMLRRSQRAKIVELVDDPEMPSTSRGTRMSIIEVNKMEALRRAGWRNVVDRRTKIGHVDNLDSDDSD